MHSYKKYFPNQNEFDFFISSNRVSESIVELVNLNNFKLINYDENITWGKSLIQTIRYIIDSDYNYLLFSFDDLILNDYIKVNIPQLISQMSAFNIHYLQIKNGYRKLFSNTKLYKDRFHKVKLSNSYRGSLVFSILDKELLIFMSNIKDLYFYNPWEYEINIHKFLNNYDLYCLPNSIVTFSNTIIKGEIDPIQLRISEKSNNYKYKGERKRMSLSLYLIFLLKVLFFKFGKNILSDSLFYKIRTFKIKLS